MTLRRTPSPPIVLSCAPVDSRMPVMLGIRFVVLADTPTELPSTLFPDAPVPTIETPNRFPTIVLRSAAAVPPIRALVTYPMLTPPLTFPAGVTPSAARPMELPATRSPLDDDTLMPLFPLPVMTLPPPVPIATSSADET